eukprot:scaffold1786_cov138-Cylindrotheca_fusiformis.AAC.7
MPAIMMNSFSTSCRKTMRRSSMNNKYSKNKGGLWDAHSMSRTLRSKDQSLHGHLRHASSDASSTSSFTSESARDDVFDTWGHFVEL